MTGYEYTVIDVGTTGLSPTTHDRVAEIAVVYVSDSGVVQDRWSTLVNPQRDVGRTDIHGITASDVVDAPTFSEIAPYVLRAIDGRVVTAHNAAFDLRFLAHKLRRIDSFSPLNEATRESLAKMATRLRVATLRAGGTPLQHGHHR